MKSPLQIAVEDLLGDVVLGIVLVVLAAVLGVIVGLVHRWQVNDQVPEGLSVLVGLSGVALYLNTSGALGQVIVGQRDLLALETAVFNVVTFFVAGLAAMAGGRLGDRTGIGFFAVSGRKSVETDVSRIVKTVGRVTSVELPDAINDIDGYDPVDPETKRKLVGQTLLFPRRLTVEQLRDRIIERLRTDYGVGHVDLDIADTGEIEYLALGSREAGIGPTLPPSSAAVAIKADPPNNASPGDIVQVWTAGSPEAETSPQRITNAELRGTAEDVVTLAMDEEEAKTLDTEARYRLATLPVEARADREFASHLRTAAETMGVVTVGEGSTIAHSVVGALDVAVVAVRTADGEIEAIPKRTRTVVPGEEIYAIGRPDRLRKLEAAGAAASGAAPETTVEE